MKKEFYEGLSERLKSVFDEKEINAYKVKVATGTSAATVSKYLNGIGKPNDSILKGICEFAGINLHWLKTGEGERDVAPHNYPNETLVENATENPVPYFSQYQYKIVNVPIIYPTGRKEYINNLDNPEYVKKHIPTYPVPMNDTSNCDNMICVEVSDDSMNHGGNLSLCKGEILICRKVSNDKWGDKLPIDKYNYLLITNSKITIRRISKFDDEIVCHPMNIIYEDFVFKVEDLKELYFVETIIGKKAY